MPERQPSPVKKVLVGTFNAVKKPPEWLGKKTVDLYDKLHAMLKKTLQSSRVDRDGGRVLERVQSLQGGQ